MEREESAPSTEDPLFAPGISEQVVFVRDHDLQNSRRCKLALASWKKGNAVPLEPISVSMAQLTQSGLDALAAEPTLVARMSKNTREKIAGQESGLKRDALEGAIADIHVESKTVWLVSSEFKSSDAPADTVIMVVVPSVKDCVNPPKYASTLLSSVEFVQVKSTNRCV